MPLSIQHQADSAGDKAVSLIADNSGSNVAAAFKGVNKATQNGDTVADLVVSLDSETVDLTIQKTEDAAHSSGDKGIMALAVRQDTLAPLAGTTGDYIPLTTDALGALNVATRGGYADNDTFTRGSSRLIAGLAGIYESTVSVLTAGKVALARLTRRGAVVTAGDASSGFATSSSVASLPTDVLVSDTDYGASMAAATTAFFNGADAGFGAAIRYIKIPMGTNNWKSATIALINGLGVSVTVTIYGRVQNSVYGADLFQLDTVSVANGGRVDFVSTALGGTPAATTRSVPSMASPLAELIVGITPASDPSSGSFQFLVARGA